MIASPPAFCTISGSVETLAGVAIENAFVRARILSGLAALSGDIALSCAPVAVYTDDEGAFELSLPQGALARIEIPESGLDAYFQVPELASASLGALGLRPLEP